MKTLSAALRYCLRRLMWEPLSCERCGQDLDFGAPWRSAPALVLERHIGRRHLAADLPAGLASGGREAQRRPIAAEVDAYADEVEVHVHPDPAFQCAYVAGLRRAAEFIVTGHRAEVGAGAQDGVTPGEPARGPGGSPS